MRSRCRLFGATCQRPRWLPDDICNHSMRATGITLRQDVGGDLDAARQIAGHANIKTTQLYNGETVPSPRAEVERVQS